MRVFFYLLILIGLTASGCIRKKASSPPAPTTAAPANAFAEVPGEVSPAATETPLPQPQTSPAPSTAPSPAPSTASQEPKTTGPARGSLTVTPDNSLTGKVATVNSAARFVVLSFPAGRLPAVDQRLNVNRRGVKVGEVKITGPQLDENIVADIVVGEADTGDEVTNR